MENKYFGILNDNTITESLHFDFLVKIKHIKYIIKKVVYEEYLDQYKNKNKLYKYINLNFKEIEEPIKVGKFEIIDFGADQKSTYSKRIILIAENEGEKTHKIHFNYSMSHHFIEFELIPLIDTLKLTNSIEIYSQLQELKSCQIKIEQLEKLIDEKDNLITQLKNQINEKIE